MDNLDDSSDPLLEIPARLPLFGTSLERVATYFADVLQVCITSSCLDTHTPLVGFHSSSCRDPSSWWHMTHISIRISFICISPRVHVARFSYPDFLKERHTTLTNITSGRPPHRIRTTNIYYPDMFVRIIDWSKQVLHVIITACHGPRSATCRVKGQEWSDGKSLPTISDSRGASHDLCQPPVGWWWPCYHLVASWQAKISPYH